MVGELVRTILRLENVKTYYILRKGLFGRLVVRAVDGVTLNFKSGEITAIVGESGCGKTTLGRTSLKLVEPTDGKIIFEDKDITHYKGDMRWFRRKAQIIFQDPFQSLNPYHSVYEILSEPLLVMGEKNRDFIEEKIVSALEEVKMTPPEEFLMKYPHMLSGGQRQRVSIARALLLDPIYLVADEPVSMIDASSRAEILTMFRNIQKSRELSVMYITHDIATTKYFSDYIAIMYAGRIVEYGPTKKVLKDPLHPYTIALIDAVPDPDPENRFKMRPVVPGEPPNPINPPPGCRFHPRCPKRFEPCDKDEPQLKEVDKDHFVACFLF
jgi:peptide/nickel transport system ATP-binding protein